jgi:hypothetical protein
VSAILWTAMGIAALVFLGMIASVPAEQRRRRQRLRPRLVADLVAAPEHKPRRR